MELWLIVLGAHITFDQSSTWIAWKLFYFIHPNKGVVREITWLKRNAQKKCALIKFLLIWCFDVFYWSRTTPRFWLQVGSSVFSFCCWKPHHSPLFSLKSSFDNLHWSSIYDFCLAVYLGVPRWRIMVLDAKISTEFFDDHYLRWSLLGFLTCKQ